MAHATRTAMAFVIANQDTTLPSGKLTLEVFHAEVFPPDLTFL
jgi:hypothetical protein